MAEDKPPLPPFTRETARRRCRPRRTRGTPATPSGSRARTPSTRSGAIATCSSAGRDEIVAFLTQKWERELDYALRKNLWCFDDNRIAVRFQYESHDRDGRWWRSYGNELWEFDEHGLMRRREASINDVPIDESERRIFGPRPEGDRGKEFPLR